MGTSRKECWETCWWVWSTVTLSAPVLSSFKHLWTLFQTDEKFSPAPPWLRRARNPNCHRRGCFQYFTEKLYILLEALWLLINCLIVDSNRSRKKKESKPCNFYFGGARSKGFATLRNVSKLPFFDKIGHAKSVGFRLYSAIWRSEEPN